MRGVRTALTLRAAARAPEDASEVRDQGSSNGPAAALGPTDVSRRRRLLRFGYRIADRARAYLLAPLEGRIGAVHGDVEALKRDVQVLQGELSKAATAQSRARVTLDNALREQAAAVAALGRAAEERALALHAKLELNRQTTETLLQIAGVHFNELQIKARPLFGFDEESYAVRLADGYVMTPRAEPTFTLMVADAPSGGLESGLRRVAQRLLEQGMQVADVGANVGLLTLAFARAVGPEGRVFAFEPEPRSVRQLEKMRLYNGLHWVKVSETAVGARRERRQFFESPIIGHSSLYELPSVEGAESRVFDVDVAPLDDLVPSSTRLDLVKIDVEGAELDVLAGMSGHLNTHRQIALIAEFGPSHLERLKVSPQAWWSAFEAHGFTPLRIVEPDGACESVSLDEACSAYSTNLLFVRPGTRAHALFARE